MLIWGLLIMTIVSFLVGFRLHDGVANGLIAFALIIVFGFAFEWVFIATGLYASNAQAAQGLALIMVPFTFVSSAYVPVSPFYVVRSLVWSAVIVLVFATISVARYRRGE